MMTIITITVKIDLNPVYIYEVRKHQIGCINIVDGGGQFVIKWMKPVKSLWAFEGFSHSYNQSTCVLVYMRLSLIKHEAVFHGKEIYAKILKPDHIRAQVS